MNLESITANLMVTDVNKTVEYYKDVLGFDLIMSVPEEGNFVWAMVRKDKTELMFQTRESMEEDIASFGDIPIGGSLGFYIRMNGLNEYYISIKEKVSIIKEPHVKFYGNKEFTIKDLNGYYLTFAEVAQN